LNKVKVIVAGSTKALKVVDLVEKEVEEKNQRRRVSQKEGRTIIIRIFPKVL
jgi:hypothetical protein